MSKFPQQRQYWHIALVVALLIASGISIVATTPYIGTNYDDAHYVGLAKALAHGAGFRELPVPGHPPETKYPPGWPMLLTPVWWFMPQFPANATFFKLVSIFCTLLFGALTYRWLRLRGQGAPLSALIVLLTLFNANVFRHASNAFSEMGYAMMAMLALISLERYSRRARPAWYEAAIPAVAVAAAFYVRTFGITLAAAGVVYLLCQRRYRSAGWLGAWCALLITPWIIHTLTTPSTTPGYWDELTMRYLEVPARGAVTPAEFAYRVIVNLRDYLLAGMPGAIFPSFIRLTHVNMAEALRLGAPFPGSDVLLALILGTSFLSQLVFRRALVDWYLFFYLGMCLIWPWEPSRFMFPMIPLLYLYFFSMIETFAKSLLRSRPAWRRRLRRWSFALLIVFVAANGALQARYAWQIHRGPHPQYADEWAARYRAFAWIREHTPADAVLASLDDYQIYLYTDRQTVRHVDEAAPLLTYGVDYIVMVPYGGVMVTGVDVGWVRFTPLYEAHRAAFTLVYEDEIGSVEIFAVDLQELRAATPQN